MIGEQLGDAIAVLIELSLKPAELLAKSDRQQTLGVGDGLTGADELVCLGEQVEPLLRRLGPIQLVTVEELLPLAFAGADQTMRVGEADDEVPGAGAGPVVEGRQRRR